MINSSTTAVAATDPVAEGSMSPADFALAKARETGQPYELTSARTETSDTWALPTGKWTVKRYGTTVRVRRAGAWVATDPTLQFAADGTVAPKASAVSIAFSGGGTGPLLTGVKDGRTLSLTWPKALPKPTLAANVATYANVLPDVDLQLKADVEGFSELLVVKTAEAAKHPDLATLKFKLDTVGLNVSSNATTGLLSAVNPAGQTVFTASAPMMWDSTTTGAAAAPQAKTAALSLAAAADAGEPAAPADAFVTPSGAKDAQMPTTVTGGNLEIKPDQALLTGAATKYPVFIDPSVAWGERQNWAWAYRSWPKNSYWNTKQDVRVGYESETNGLSRSFFQLDTANLKGAQVTKSTFRIKETWSWSCTPTPVELWTTGPISSATTWNSQPGKGTKLATVSAAKGRPDCGAGNLEFDATAAAKESASKGWSSVTLGLYASNESDQYQWKRFDPKTITLETEYNNPPRTPADPGTSPWVPCVEGGKIGNTTIGLYSTISDPDAGNLSAEYQIFKAGQSTPVATQTLPANNGKVATWNVPDTSLPDGDYTWKVRATDQDHATSAWSQTCKFSVDRTRPAKAPKISSTVFPDGKSGWPAGTGKARTPGSFTLAANDVKDATWYGYYTDWNPELKSATVAPGASVDVQLTPPGAGPHFVYAFSQDAAGNRSDTTAYLFYAARSAAQDTAGDLNGDGNRDIWSNDSFGNLLTYAGQGNAKFTAATRAGKNFNGARLDTLGDWDGDGYNDLVSLEQPSGMTAKKLFAYANNGQGGADNPVEMTVACPVKNPGAGCDYGPDWNGDDHWYNAEQVLAPGDLNGDGTPDLLVKQGKQLWAYYGSVFGTLDGNGEPVLVGNTDWDKYTVVAPGDVNGDKVPDLWLRDNATGDILRTYGKKSKDPQFVVDLATWGTQTRTKIGGGVTQAAFPQIGSVGDVSGDGVSDLWARQADNTVLGWNGVASGGTVTAFSANYQIDGVPGAKIPAGTTLASGEEFSSGNSKLVMRADGNLVLTTKDNKQIWSTNTGGNNGAVARMQNDGNFVVYAANGTTALWSSKTTTPYSYAVLQSRGVLVIYNASGQSLWTSGSQSRPDYNGDGFTDVLARDAQGDAWVYQGTGGSGTSTLGSRYFIGNGFWRDYWTHLYTADLNNDGRTDIVGRTKEGDLYLFPGTGGTDTNSFAGRYLIGVGWNGYDLGFGDVNLDGRTDVFARDANADLWVYPGSGGTGTSTLSARTFIGNGFWPGGWETLRYADLNGDSKIDIVGRTDQGDVYLFPNSTGADGKISFGARTFEGNGWWVGGWTPYPADLNSDGAAEHVGVLNNGELYDFLPNQGRVLVGNGWNAYDVVL
ncbi:FG-GAP-like repeat-containing protein [Streptomyces katrae]|uniref:FG-GAP-like repeat-containing protein n=1 Tax=Streptomyces katrae TaxID=68223 RepID=UPI00068AB70C|nr:FG-GAP-like repeat-containing protein [Streptomyces katrae]